ncbi:hypothetical protein DFA_07913 [Cavenderia fasciculata]|uniref:Beta-lactamase-related domain-containing protein n=1 Tax=Cavenderia fasciculata TaxID=261658 RepID=F4Q418_CACFS|nr:uncharacterized protein DFA_07913 [Cavenderia fasciculata]EGG16932.1 hypothetical protein DFA_07913 [Cavenderia fasciculata]|eukprot:XP_004355406.1 hypothetical protein DFA_07913 [Cavenderia fasciculata]
MIQKDSYQIEEISHDKVIKPLEEWMKHQIKEKGVPAFALTVTNRTTPLFSNIYHHPNIKTPLLSPTKSLFKVASVSKLFTYVALLQLVEQGKINLNDPITKYIPGFKVKNPPTRPDSDDLYKTITVFNLIRHTSGLIREPIGGNYFNYQQCNLEELVISMNQSTLVSVPGTTYKYSNAAVAMAVFASGISFEEYLEKNVFEKIGMNDSTFRDIHNNTRCEKEDQVRLTVGHQWRYWDETKTDTGVFQEAPLTHFGMFPAGCLKTTLPDIQKFLRVILNNGSPLLKESTYLLMITPQPLDKPLTEPRQTLKYAPSPYGDEHGLGADVSPLFNLLQVRHGGAINGFASDFRVIPELGIGFYGVTTLDCANTITYNMVEYFVHLLIMAKPPSHLPHLDMVAVKRCGDLVESSLLAKPLTEQETNQVVGVYKYNDTNSVDSNVLRDTNRYTVYPEYDGNVYLRTQFINKLATIHNSVTQAADGTIPIVTNDRLSYLQVLNVKLAQDGGHLVNDGVFKKSKEDTQRYPLLYQPYYPLPSPSTPPPHANTLFESLCGHYHAQDQIVLVFEEDGMLSMCIEWFFIYHLYIKNQYEDRIEFQLATDCMYNDEPVTIYFDTSLNAAGDKVYRPKLFSLAGIPFVYHITGPIPGQIQEGVEKESVVKAIVAKSVSVPCPHPQPPTNELVDLSTLHPTLKIDVKYATSDNFAGVQFYPIAKAFLHRKSAESLVRAHQWLEQWGLGIVVFDAYRPWNVTWAMSESVKQEYRGLYVADPAKGSVHNRGGAADISLYDLKTGQIIQMPGEYDEFSVRSHRSYFGGTTRQRWSKKLLTIAMMNHGFLPYPQEWWHFDFTESFPVLNVQFKDLIK